MNPLLNHDDHVHFAEVKPEHVVPALEEVTSKGRETIQKICDCTENSYASLFEELDRCDLMIERTWSPVLLLTSLADSKEIREQFNIARKIVIEFSNEVRANQTLYNKLKDFSENNDLASLSVEQRKVVENRLKDFKLCGAELSSEDKKKYQALTLDLSNMSTKFAENVLDSTNSFSLHITDAAELSGLPESTLHSLSEEAKRRGLEGYILSLQMPVVNAVMRYAESEELRKKIHTEFNRRASHGEFDNSEIMVQILEKRKEMSNLLGFDTYADYSLAKKTAKSPQEVLDFLYQLKDKSEEAGQQDYDELLEHKKSLGLEGPVQPWERVYIAEKLRQSRFSFSEEDLRCYFPMNAVLQGLFEICHRVFGVRAEEVESTKTWHPSVRYFHLYDDKKNDLLGSFFFDFYPRAEKRGGAWMQDLLVRTTRADGTLEKPLGLIAGNVTPPTEDGPALLTHREVVTLFHEFGHVIHLLFTQCQHYSTSGLNGVPWDVVELPSQIMENWAWQKESLKLFAHHHETGEPISDELCEKMLAARNFQQATIIRRQLEFSLLDMHLHYDYDGKISLREFEEKMHNALSPIPAVEGSFFLPAFRHIFAGGYAAGYFSYKWAEVWEADAFQVFLEKGIFDLETGLAFRNNILACGGSEDPNELYTRFRGRSPKVDAFLTKHGLAV